VREEESVCQHQPRSRDKGRREESSARRREGLEEEEEVEDSRSRTFLNP